MRLETPNISQIYGSARIGSLKTKVDVFGSAYEDYTDVITTHAIGDRNYELSNHLGNILTVISDKLIPKFESSAPTIVSGYTADLVMSCDYSPFGVTLAGRGVEGSYRYGFNGMEADDEIKGDGNSYDFGARMYDSRVGRFLSLDPLAKDYPSLSDYSFVANSPLIYVDPSGKKIVLAGNEQQKNEMLATLQMLTNDKLEVDMTTGLVSIVSVDTENCSKILPLGTQLIGDLIGNEERTVTIDYENSTGILCGTQASENNCTLEPGKIKDATDGKTGVDCMVNYAPNSPADCYTRNPESGEVEEVDIPMYIILAHELIHAEHAVSGNLTLGKADYVWKGPVSSYTDNADLEELITVGIKGEAKYTENNIRAEHFPSCETNEEKQILGERIEY